MCRVLCSVLFALLLVQTARAQEPLDTRGVDLAGEVTFRMLVRMQAPPQDLPGLAVNKDWLGGAVRDYTTNNAYGLGRESGAEPGFAISVLPDGAWTWNVSDGRVRLDHRPEAADQGIADGRWHEVGFALDRKRGVAHLYHDGRRVALHDLSGLGSIEANPVNAGSLPGRGIEIAEVRLEPGARTPAEVEREFVARFGEERRPPARQSWDGGELKVLAWNIWHGGRRKGRDEGVQRVVDVIRDSGADLVLMQETYGSGPRISGRLGFDYCLRSSNLSVHSRFPITAVHRLYQSFRFGGVTVELRPGTEVQAYSLWINHLPSVSKQLAAGATGAQLAAEDEKTRGLEMQGVLDDLLPHLAQTPDVPVLVGGDFNSGSHLDWTPETAQLANHQGRVVTWPVSARMAAAGFVDTFRAAHPDPIAAPGHTWSPEFPGSHQDRIDYVYARGEAWEVVNSRVLEEHPDGWPSDHAAVLTTLRLRPPGPRLRVMSYNIHYGVGLDGERDLARIARVITEANVDLVGLQEIGNAAMAEELSRLTGMPFVFGASKGSDQEYGDAILSNLPFEWAGNHELPSASSSRYQAMAVDVDLASRFGAGAALRFVNTHFDWLDTLGSQQARLAAVEVIEAGFFDGGERPALLAGDLNATPDSAPLALLAEKGWHHGTLGRTLPTIGDPTPDRQIDYVLVRPRASWRILDVEVLNEPIASDHRPVVLTLQPSTPR